MTETITVQNEDETIAAAAVFAQTLRPKDVVLFNGNLGAGKTFFCRALIRALTGSDVDVPSPTFTLLQTYETSKGDIWHYDLYRIQDPEEIWELDWEDALAEGITLVEWPDRLGPFTPKNAIKVTLTPDPKNETARTIKIER